MRTIRVKEKDERIVIKPKHPHAFLWVAVVLCVNSVQMAYYSYLLMELYQNFVIAAVIILDCIYLTGVIIILSRFWRGVTINKKDKTVSVFRYLVKKFPISEIAKCTVQPVATDGNPNSKPAYPHILFDLKDGKKIRLRVRDNEQAAELRQHVLAGIIQYIGIPATTNADSGLKINGN